jgi:hypothetical protein
MCCAVVFVNPRYFVAGVFCVQDKIIARGNHEPYLIFNLMIF